MMAGSRVWLIIDAQRCQRMASAPLGPSLQAVQDQRVLSPAGSPAREGVLRRRKIPRGALVEVLHYAPTGSWGSRTAIPHLRFAPVGGTPWPVRRTPDSCGDASQLPPSSGLPPLAGARVAEARSLTLTVHR